MQDSDNQNVITPTTGEGEQPAITTSQPTVSEQPTVVSSTVGDKYPGAKSAKLKYVHYALHAVLLVALVVLGLQFADAKSNNAELQKQVTALENNPLLVAERKTNETIAAVSRLTAVPAGDTPTVSEVSDAEAVKKSIVGLTDVQNGDKLLFYFKGAKFIQYRPSTDKIVLNQPLNVR